MGKPRRHKIVHISSSPIRLNRMNINPQWLYRLTVICTSTPLVPFWQLRVRGSRHYWWTSICIISLAIIRHGRGSEGSWPARITQVCRKAAYTRHMPWPARTTPMDTDVWPSRLSTYHPIWTLITQEEPGDDVFTDKLRWSWLDRHFLSPSM